MGSNNQWNVVQEAMPQNLQTGQGLLDAIHGQLKDLLEVAEQFRPVFIGRAFDSWEAFQQKVTNAGAMTNVAFGKLQDTNGKAYEYLEQGVDLQTEEATKSAASTTENPVKWMAG